MGTEIVTMDDDDFHITNRKVNLRGQVAATAKIFGAVCQRDEGRNNLYSLAIVAGILVTGVGLTLWLDNPPGVRPLSELIIRVIVLGLGLIALIGGIVLKMRYPGGFCIFVFAPNGFVIKAPVGTEKELGYKVVQAIGRAMVPNPKRERILEWGPRFVLSRRLFLARGPFKLRETGAKVSRHGEFYDSPADDPFEISDDVVGVFSLRHIYSMTVRETPDAWNRTSALAVGPVQIESWVRELLAFSLVLSGKNGNCEVPAFFGERADMLRKIGKMILSAADDLRDR